VCTKKKNQGFRCTLAFGLIPNVPPTGLLFLEIYDQVKAGRPGAQKMARNAQEMLRVMTFINAVLMFVGAALIERFKSSSNRLSRSMSRKSQ
jgi:hypothetical protein